MTEATSTVLQMLEKAGAFVPTVRMRGRPPYHSMTTAQLRRLPSYRLAVEVYKELARSEKCRGAYARALEKVAKAHGRRVDEIKKFAARHRFQRDRQQLLWDLRMTMQELERRMLGMPDDVTEWLDSRFTVGRLLQYLRDQGIDQTCPTWLIDKVRSTDLSSPK